jgi:uncharacterized membrane protein YoaK (UPF0700 family)
MIRFMKRRPNRYNAYREDSRVMPGKTMIEAACVARKSARVMGSEFLGVTALSFVGGFVDTAGFIALFGLFTAHVTGDLVTGAAALSQGINSGGLVKLLMIPIFVVTIALATLFLRAIRRRGALSVAPLLAVMTLLMAAFGAAGWWFQPRLTSINNWEVILVGGLGVAAMGVQNALMRGALRSFSQTTMMTGNLTQFTIDLVERLFLPRDCTPKEREEHKIKAGRRLRKSFFPLLGFMAGAAGGAFGMSPEAVQLLGLSPLDRFLCMAVPTGILFILTLITLWRSRHVE